MEIEWAKARLIPPGHYLERAQTAGRTPARPARPGRRVVPALRAGEAPPAGPRLRGPARISWPTTWSPTRAFAAVQRWRFQHLFVDELQDANPAQLRLLDTWLGHRERPVRGRRPAAGDLRLERRRPERRHAVRRAIPGRDRPRARDELPLDAAGRGGRGGGTPARRHTAGRGGTRRGDSARGGVRLRSRRGGRRRGGTPAPPPARLAVVNLRHPRQDERPARRVRVGACRGRRAVPRQHWRRLPRQTRRPRGTRTPRGPDRT